MSSKAASAVYPHLAANEVDKPLAKIEGEKPSWGQRPVNDLKWVEHRERGYAKVPGLVKVSKQRSK